MKLWPVSYKLIRALLKWKLFSKSCWRLWKNLTINIHEHKQINCFFVSNPHFCNEKGFWVSRFTCSYTDFIISNSGHVYYECSPLYLWQKMGKSIIGSLLLNGPVLIYSTFLLKLLKHVYTTWWGIFSTSKWSLSDIHIPMNRSGLNWSSVSCPILFLACRVEQPEIKQPNVRLVDDLVYLLSHS